MYASLSSVFAAATVLLLVARPAAAAPAAAADCTPGTWSCVDQHEGSEYGSYIRVCNSSGYWQLSANCGTTYGHPGCVVDNGGLGAHCIP